MKTMKYLLIFSLCLILAGLIDAGKPCGAWKPYKTEKCFKIFPKLANYTNAAATCSAQDDATLVSIGSAHEQSFLKQYLFTGNQIVDTVWLGGRYTEGQFTWEDGANWTHSNWASGSPQNKEGYCLQMNSEDNLLASWTDVSCLKRNLIVCQRAQPVEGLIAEIKREFEQHLAEYTEVVKELTEKNDHLEGKITQLEGNSLPLGYIYVQFPKEKSPVAIWPSMNWTDVSSAYAGVFFRAADGGGADTFGAIQEENVPTIDKVEAEGCLWDSPGKCHYGPSSYSFSPFVSLPKTSGWSDYVGGNQLWPTGSGGFYPQVLHRYHTISGEVRPRNMAIKVWKRSA